MIYFMVIVLGMGTIIPGCSLFQSPQSPKERAEEYWKYKVSGEMEKAYLYETPEFRNNMKMKDYMGGESKWLDARVGDVKITDNEAEVQVTIRFALLRPWFPNDGIEKTVPDRWVLIDNVWYHEFGRGAAEKKTQK